MARTAQTKVKSSRSRAPSRAVSQKAPTEPSVDIQAVIDTLAVVSHLDAKQRRKFYKDNPEAKDAMLKVSGDMKDLINQSKCLAKRAVEKATDGWWGNIVIPLGLGVLAIGGLGGGMYLNDKYSSNG